MSILSSKDACSTDSFDFFLGHSGKESGLHYDWLLGLNTFAEDFEVACTTDVDDRDFLWIAGPQTSLLSDKRPKLVQVDGRTVFVGHIGMNMKVSHADLSQVSRVVLVKVYTVMMLDTCIATATRMFPMLANTTMSVRNVST